MMSGHVAFNKYLEQMRISESAECSNCDIRGMVIPERAEIPSLRVWYFYMNEKWYK